MKKAIIFSLLFVITTVMVSAAGAKNNSPIVEPFQIELTAQLNPSNSGQGNFIWFTVPEDKLLIIETVSARYVFQENEIPEGNYGSVSLTTALSKDAPGNEDIQHFFPLFVLGNNSGRMASCHYVRIYAGPGTDVGYFFSKDSGPEIVAQLSISGQLIPVR